MVLKLHEPGFNRRISPLSVAAWHRVVEEGLAPEKSELLRGVIVEKIPKSIWHVQLVGRLFLMLQSLVGHMCNSQDMADCLSLSDLPARMGGLFAGIA